MNLPELQAALAKEEAYVSSLLASCAADHSTPPANYWHRLWELRQLVRIAEDLHPVIREELTK